MRCDQSFACTESDVGSLTPAMGGQLVYRVPLLGVGVYRLKRSALSRTSQGPVGDVDSLVLMPRITAFRVMLWKRLAMTNFRVWRLPNSALSVANKPLSLGLSPFVYLLRVNFPGGSGDKDCPRSRRDRTSGFSCSGSMSVEKARYSFVSDLVDVNFGFYSAAAHGSWLCQYHTIL